MKFTSAQRQLKSLDEQMVIGKVAARHRAWNFELLYVVLRIKKADVDVQRNWVVGARSLAG
jgi:hypothetical protein